MADPTVSVSVGIVSLSVTLLGPMAGPYTAIVLCSGIGAMWALAAAPTATGRVGALLMLRLVLTAVVLTVAIAEILEKLHGWPPDRALGMIAFAIGVGGERWRALGDLVYAKFTKQFGGGV